MLAISDGLTGGLVAESEFERDTDVSGHPQHICDHR